MGYSTDRKKIPMTSIISLYSDGCGDSYEKKYYVNGAYIDLCGLSIEEYMKNPCCCGGCSGGGSDSDDDDNTKRTNDIFVKSFEQDGVIYYQAFSTFSVTSNLKITVPSSTGTVTELDLYAGDTQSKPEIGETIDFLGVSINIDEDDYYQYVISTEEGDSIYNVYLKAIHFTEAGAYSDDFDKIMLNYGTSADIMYIIPESEINYNEMEDMEEFEQFCKDNLHCLALCLPKTIYDNEEYIITNYGGTDITDKFTFVDEVVIDGEEFVFLNESATDDIMPFVPVYGEEIMYEYKLTFQKREKKFNAYTKAIHLNETGVYTEDFEQKPLETEKTVDIKFIIPASEFDYNNMEDMDEFEKFCIENQYCLGLCLPKEVFENKEYLIENYGGTDVTNKFVYVKDVTINGSKYVFLDERATDDIMPFVPLYGEEIVYEYKLTLKNKK